MPDTLIKPASAAQKLLPVVAILGCPNVGKSTLFNALTGTRAALVADLPGLTRDRHYGTARIGDRRVLLIDTGGLGDARDALARHVGEQALHALDEADLSLFVVDGRHGAGAADAELAALLRSRDTPCLVVVNKTEALDEDVACGEFHAYGLGQPLAIAAAHRRGLHELVEAITRRLPAPVETPDEDVTAPVAVAIVGRPNVGKSTLINRLTGEQRVVAHDQPGTTRDTIEVPFSHAGMRYTLLDTAGIRRRGRIAEVVEKFSVIKSLQAIAACNVAVVMLDAREGVTDQDLHLLGEVVDQGRALVLAVNKWDGLGSEQRGAVRTAIERRIRFADYAGRCYLSALHGSGLGELLTMIHTAWSSATRKFSTTELTRVVRAAVERTPPPMVRGRRIKLRYAHQGGSNPPRIIIHGTQAEKAPAHYRRYLEHALREVFDLIGTPVQVELRSGENPYKDRTNVLSPRQHRQRKRLIRHVKKR